MRRTDRQAWGGGAADCSLYPHPGRAARRLVLQLEGPTRTSTTREHRFAEDRILEAVCLQQQAPKVGLRSMACAPPARESREPRMSKGSKAKKTRTADGRLNMLAPRGGDGRGRPHQRAVELDLDIVNA